MIDATVTEKLALCMIKENKTLNSALADTDSYLLLSMLLEMVDEGCLSFSDKKFKWYEALIDGAFRLTGMPPYEAHKRLLYNALAAYEKPDIPFTYAIGPENSMFSEKNARAIIDSLTDSLILKGYARRERKKLIVNEQVFAEISEEVRKGILCRESASEDTLTLILLLEGWGGVLKRFFNAYERKTYQKCIKNLFEDKSNPRFAAILKFLEYKDAEDASNISLMMLTM